MQPDVSREGGKKEAIESGRAGGRGGARGPRARKEVRNGVVVVGNMQPDVSREGSYWGTGGGEVCSWCL